MIFGYCRHAGCNTPLKPPTIREAFERVQNCVKGHANYVEPRETARWAVDLERRIARLECGGVEVEPEEDLVG